MRFIITALLLAATIAQAAASDYVPRRPRVVRDLDLELVCTGVWHGIASIPGRSNRDCACCPETEFVLVADDEIRMTNRCLKPDGDTKLFEAEVDIVDPRTRARWKMAPFKILGLKPVKADMWIIGRGEGHAWLVIGDPDRERGWILAREPVLAPETRAEIDALLARQGYDTGLFVDDVPTADARTSP